MAKSHSSLCHTEVCWMRWRKAFLCGEFNPKQYLSCLSDCHAVISHTHSHGSSVSPHYHLFEISYNPFLNYRTGYHAVSNNNSHVYCLSIVRRTPSLASARTHNHHTQRALPSTLHGSSGQRSPVASGLQDNSLAVPDTELVSPPHRPPSTHTQALSHTETAFVPKLLCIKREPNIYSQTLFNTLQWKCRRPP